MSTTSTVSIRHPIDSLRTLCTTQQYFNVASVVLLAGELVLCQLIIRHVAYTEIDWSTYMQQVQLVEKGERDYSRIQGDTGPLVYPAGHVYLYTLLAWVTEGGKDVWLAQQIFAGVYLLSLFFVTRLFAATKSMPTLALFVLPLSKRLHSIYVLRLFNDGLAMLFLYATIYALVKKRQTATAVLYSLALSIKMNILLFLPGILVLFLLSSGLKATLRQVSLIVLIQILLALPFALENPQAYLKGAFDLSRVFLHEWTVNWRFIPEHTFASRSFANLLLLLHASWLFHFGLKWLEPHGGLFRVTRRLLAAPQHAGTLFPSLLTPDFALYVIFTSNLIGILFARSLHYQFYSWYAWQAVFLVFRAPLPPVSRFGILIGIEACWNIFPSTKMSSGVLLLLHACLLMGCYQIEPVAYRGPSSRKSLKVQ